MFALNAMIHSVKCLPEFFDDVCKEKKLFEVRKNDRPYKVGDYIALNEWRGEYTHRSVLLKIDYILDDKEYCKEGYIIMSVKPVTIYQYIWKDK